jgi:hypothetical protein
MIPLWKGKNPIYFGVITIIPFDNLYRLAYFVMHTFLVNKCILLFVTDISSLISDWLNQVGMDFLAGVKQGGRHLILKRLGLEEFFSGPVCNGERKPYSPSVDGWNNGMYARFTYLKYLEFK